MTDSKNSVETSAADAPEKTPTLVDAESPSEDAAAVETAPAEIVADDSLEYVLTVSASSGDILRVETLDKSGVRTELTEEEYATISSAAGYDISGAVYSEEAAAVPEDPYGAGYAQGVADYQGALAGGPQSPEEAAYYQGLADYQGALEAAAAQNVAGYSAEELAYYQGMADCEAAINQAGSGQ
jgi:hypothetical protein